MIIKKMKCSGLSIIRNPRDYKKNSNYRDFELSRSLKYQEERKKFELLGAFIIFLKICMSLHKFYIWPQVKR